MNAYVSEVIRQFFGVRFVKVVTNIGFRSTSLHSDEIVDLTFERPDRNGGIH